MSLVLDSSSRSPKSPKSPENSITEKSKKYDRQLRLWGAHGQSALESSRVCLINANATGTEILKNLVLPGIGSFMIVDGNTVTGEDVGNNFFLEKDSIGKSRGREAMRMLLEMNSDVRGDCIEESAENVLASDAQFFTNFSIVIANGVYNEKTLLQLSALLWQANVPLLICKTIGLIGIMRLQVREHTIIESQPENVLEDLRLDDPFDELKKYLDSYREFQQMERKELAHTPYLVVLYRYLNKWRETYQKEEKSLPETYKEKEQLREIIRKEMNTLQELKKDVDGELKELELENFEEAIKSVNKVLVASKFVPTDTLSILNDPQVESSSSSFWLMIRALKEFMTKNKGCLPVRGSIPDMISDSAKYIQLQKIYSNKAKEDVESMLGLIQAMDESRRRHQDGKCITENDVRMLCKNAHCLKLVRTSSIESELTGEPIKELINSLQGSDEGNDELIFYLLLRSVDRFNFLHNRFPGQFSGEGDVALLKANFRELQNDLGCTSLARDDCIHEICRCGGCELHSVAAFLGGCAAQEVIKLVTGQFVPIDNTFVYNAINSTTVTYKI